MVSASPEHHLRRSQLYRIHQSAGAYFEDQDGTLSVSQYAGNADELGQARRLGLADLSTLSRIGFKGHGAPAWLHTQGVLLPEQPNQTLLQTDGSLLLRLSAQEVLILRALHPASALITQLQNQVSSAAAQHAYVLPRADSHCWLALTGEYAAQTLAKICGVDMRLHKFAQGDVAQTSVARVNAIVTRYALEADTPCFYILCDVSLAEFLWVSLIDTMLEFGGQPIGLATLRQLQPTKPSSPS